MACLVLITMPLLFISGLGKNGASGLVFETTPHCTPLRGLTSMFLRHGYISLLGQSETACKKQGLVTLLLLHTCP